MHVFVTGGAGFVGRAVISDLISHGHSVLGLARNEANADILRSLGATPHTGDMEDAASLAAGARQTDATVHLAFRHDFSNLGAAIELDIGAIQAMGDALQGTGKPLVVASATLLLPPGVLAKEDGQPSRDRPPFTERARSADLVKVLSDTKEVRGMVVRLSPTVHEGGEDNGLLPRLFAQAKQTGSVVYVDGGETRWPAVHRQDAAALFRLALEKGQAGQTYHAVAEEGIRMREVMELAGRKLGLPVKSESLEQASQSVGMLAYMISTDNPASSEATQRELGWKPTHVGLLEDLEKNYFK